ncbi:MAG: ABC transporter substrate-binding protein [Sulfolobales archaeon]|nr:ABC transporter substrate-binding protein [Sulfolobales archaeon]MDW8083283.1 ABC transporter substrate-binding protein [Sulfolobales archaeon]
MSTPLKTPYVLAVFLLILGVVAGFFVGQGAAPTRTITVTTLVTSPVAPVGLTGEVRIGALLPLTGVLSTFGAQYRVVIELAEREINGYLTALGRPWRIKFVFEDTATDPKTHLDKLMALHGAGVRVFIGGASSAELSEALGYCNANRILIISPSSTSPALALEDMALRYTLNDIYQGKAIAKIMWLRGVRWVIPVWRGDTWGDGLSKYTNDYFKEICRASGERCGVLEADAIRYDPKATEFSVEAARLNDAVSRAAAAYGRDKVGILLISFEEAAAIFAAAKAYPILQEVKWTGSDGTAAIEPLRDPAIADVVMKVGFYNTMASPGVSPHGEKIRREVKTKLGMEPMGYTYFVYDIAWTLALAIDAANSYDPVKVMGILPSILGRYLGGSGYIELDKNGDRSIGDYDIWAIVKVGDRYEWKVIGIYRGLTETIELYS